MCVFANVLFVNAFCLFYTYWSNIPGPVSFLQIILHEWFSIVSWFYGTKELIITEVVTQLNTQKHYKDYYNLIPHK